MPNKLLEYAELVGQNFDHVRKIPEECQRRLAIGKVVADQSTELPSATIISAHTNDTRARIDRVIEVESRNLIDGYLDPLLVAPSVELQEKLIRLGGNAWYFDHERQKSAVEYIHSQQLALALAPLISEAALHYLDGKDTVEFTEIGAKNGDLAARIQFEVQRRGIELNAKAYDINPQRSLAPRFATRLSQPERTLPVRHADISRFIHKPGDIVLLSNILHKIPRGSQIQALRNLNDRLDPGALLVVNAPYYSQDDATSNLGLVYRVLDGTDYKDAILEWNDLRKIILAAGFEILSEEDLGYKASLLDGFRHRAIVARKPNIINQFQHDDFTGTVARAHCQPKVAEQGA